MNILDPQQVFKERPTKQGISNWRRMCKVQMLKDFPNCTQCGGKLTEDTGASLHESPVTRADTRGAKWQWMIFSQVNMWLLCHACHQNPNSREWFRDRSETLYGSDLVDAFLEGLPWKVRPRKQVFLPSYRRG